MKSLELNRALKVIPKVITHAGWSGSFGTYFEACMDQLDTSCRKGREKLVRFVIWKFCLEVHCLKRTDLVRSEQVA